VHTPAWHVSSCVHALPSLHAVPFDFCVGGEQTPVAGLHVPAVLQLFPPLQTTGFAPVQTPAWHVSTNVQALPSLQGLPSGTAELEHAPVSGSQTPARWHASAGAHATGLPPWQTPAWQVSTCVQALPSSQGVPLSGTAAEHAPVEGLHVPGWKHAPGDAQTTGL
jgi:hypothetical protein